MNILEYQVVDPLSASYNLYMLGLGSLPIILFYARKGEEGLLEDFLEEKKFLFFPPRELEVDDSFSSFNIILSTKIKEIDLAKDSGRVIIRSKPLEPSVN